MAKPLGDSGEVHGDIVAVRGSAFQWLSCFMPAQRRAIPP
jgi:hypothetical protein